MAFFVCLFKIFQKCLVTSLRLCSPVKEGKRPLCSGSPRSYRTTKILKFSASPFPGTQGVEAAESESQSRYCLVRAV